MRPTFELVCGQFSLRERIVRHWPVVEWGAHLRPVLQAVYQEEHPEAHLNNVDWMLGEKTVCINGRWLPTLADLSAIVDSEVGYSCDRIAYLTVDSLEVDALRHLDIGDALQQLASSRIKRNVEGPVVRYPWDLVNENARQLAEDFRTRRYAAVDPTLYSQVSILGSIEQVAIDSTAEIDPFVVIDARQGPVSIDAHAQVGSFTKLTGPCHVGMESRLYQAQVSGGTTIGPVCRVGGEVDSSILQHHVNKYHAGFVGHSYLCPWVNLGALTTNSDIKNDYSPVSVPLAGEMIESGMAKVGCFIGDHTRTALNSLFNTGSAIGPVSMVLADGRLLPKYVPPFANVWKGELTTGWDCDRTLAAIRRAMARRDCELSTAGAQLVKTLHIQTESLRELAIERNAIRQNVA